MSTVSFVQAFRFLKQKNKTKDKIVFLSHERNHYFFTSEVQKAEVLVSAGAVDLFIYHCFPHFPTCTAYEICEGIGENLNTGYLSAFLNNTAHSFKLLCVTSGVQCL